MIFAMSVESKFVAIQHHNVLPNCCTILVKKKVDERVGLDQIVRDELDTIKRATLSYLTN